MGCKALFILGFGTGILYFGNSLSCFLKRLNVQEQSLLARILGEETQARVVESVADWASDKVAEGY